MLSLQDGCLLQFSTHLYLCTSYAAFSEKVDLFFMIYALVQKKENIG